jgi:hypothetical protein
MVHVQKPYFKFIYFNCLQARCVCATAYMLHSKAIFQKFVTL